MSVTLTIILDTRRIKTKSNKFPVKLRVTFKRVTEYYQTIFDLSKEDYEKLTASRISLELQDVRTKLKEMEHVCEAEVYRLNPFNFQDFEKKCIVDNYLFRQRKSIKQVPASPEWDFDFGPFMKRFSILKEADCAVDQIRSVYVTYIKKLIIEGRIGTALSYQCSYVSIKKFRGNVRFSEITVSFLTQYEQFMRSKNISKSTVGIYLRPLRCIFNEAIAGEIIEEKKCYPFGKRKYQIPTSKNVKKALDTSDVSKIFYYKTDNESQQKSRDFWLFSYFGNGMNIKDIALLKFGNIHGEYLVFERSKTERTMRSDPKPISIFLTEDMWAIINRWGNKDRHVNNYIFPILVPGLNSLRVYELVQGFIHFMNENMAIVKSNLNIDKKVTTYVARHTFSTVLKRSGVSTEYIQEALGHTDIKTTENYLDSFGKDMKKEFANKLTAFKVNDDLVK